MQHLNPLVYTGTAKGPFRDKNEDSIGVIERPDVKNGIDAVYAVADGLGGHERGEVASSLAISMLMNVFGAENQHPGNITEDLSDFLYSTLCAISQSICDVGVTGESIHRDPFTAGMATTLTAAVLVGRNIYIGHAGDSRAYLINNEEISQVTEDHTLVEEQIRQGVISREQGKFLNRNVITQALGLDKPLYPYTSCHNLSKGDTLLICSDGLHGFLDDKSILGVMKTSGHNDTPKSLIQAALDAGSNDNISVVLVSF
jgi:protein phosphatase